MIKYAITDPNFYKDLSFAFGNFTALQDVDFVLLRDQSSNNYQGLAKDFLSFKDSFRAKFILHNDISLAFKLGADGVHFSSARLQYIPNTPPNLIKIASTHNVLEILTACKNGANYITFSPIFECGKGAPKGVEELKKAVHIASRFKVGVIALGGILGKKHISLVMGGGAVGFGSIRYFAHC